MPSGPSGLHQYWSAKGPYYEHGNWNAQKHLTDRGYILTPKWEWISPTVDEPEEEDWSAINYLAWEWDFGGLTAPSITPR